MDEDKIEEINVEEELKKLEAELNGEPEVKTEEPPVEAPAETPAEKEPEVDIEEAAFSVFSRMSPEKKQGYLKKMGIEAVEKTVREQDEKDIAAGAAKASAETVLKEIRGSVSSDELPDGFDDLEESDQALILSDIRTKREAKKLFDEWSAPIQQERAERDMNALFDNTAQEWAKEMQVPEAAQDIRSYISTFSQEEVELYFSQASPDPNTGVPRGGAFVRMVHENVKQIGEKAKAAIVQQKSEEPPPKAEPAGGKETYGGSSEADGLAAYLASKPEFANDKDFLEEVRSMAL